jgi:hypothetical protein
MSVLYTAEHLTLAHNFDYEDCDRAFDDDDAFQQHLRDLPRHSMGLRA